jgi:hypothetical protein
MHGSLPASFERHAEIHPASGRVSISRHLFVRASGGILAAIETEATMNPETETKIDRRSNHGLAAGIFLILFGAAALLQTWVDIGNYVVLLLGAGMLVWGSISRRKGWLIPGGVLTGIGLGIFAMEGPWHFPDAIKGGIFLLCFAFGWFLIVLLSALFTCAQWWALIPGGIMAVIGGTILATNGLVRWQDLNLFYAAALISVGVILIALRGRSRRNE